jgi:hypothetical protein
MPEQPTFTLPGRNEFTPAQGKSPKDFLQKAMNAETPLFAGKKCLTCASRAAYDRQQQ